MGYFYEAEAELRTDGMVHVAVPNAQPGDRFRILFEKEEAVAVEEVDGKPVRVFGQGKGRGKILPGFYDPIEVD